MGGVEKRKVEDVTHKATKEVVEKAKELKGKGEEVLIVVGDVKGIRKKRRKYVRRCRRNNTHHSCAGDVASEEKGLRGNSYARTAD